MKFITVLAFTFITASIQSTAAAVQEDSCCGMSNGEACPLGTVDASEAVRDAIGAMYGGIKYTMDFEIPSVVCCDPDEINDEFDADTRLEACKRTTTSSSGSENDESAASGKTQVGGIECCNHPAAPCPEGMQDYTTSKSLRSLATGVVCCPLDGDVGSVDADAVRPSCVASPVQTAEAETEAVTHAGDASTTPVAEAEVESSEDSSGAVTAEETGNAAPKEGVNTVVGLALAVVGLVAV